MIYESAAYIILTMPSLDLQLNYLNNMMAQQNAVVGESFDLLKHQCLINVKFIHAVGSNSLDSLKAIIQYLKINIVICNVLGNLYRYHLKQITPLLIECYKIANSDENNSLPKRIRKAVIQLLECFILSINSQVDILEIQGLFQVIAADYIQSSDQREPLVLSLLANIFEKIDVRIRNTPISPCLYPLMMLLEPSCNSLARYPESDNRYCVFSYITNAHPELFGFS